jgi:uncharacterized membrane protein (UPF0127 family)
MESLSHYIAANRYKTIILLLLILSIVAFVMKMSLPDNACGKYAVEIIYLNDKTLSVQIADNDCKRILGLSGKSWLFKDEGMLFVFDVLDDHAFWMKDMNFPIDILWLDDTLKVVGIEKRLSPETFPEIFGKDFVSKYVLEVNSGFVDENKIKVGNIIYLDKKEY